MEDTFVIYYPKPIFRNTYNLVLGVLHRNRTNFEYCSNCKQWIAMKDGNEIGLLTNEGIEYAESYLAPYFRDNLKNMNIEYNHQ